MIGRTASSAALQWRQQIIIVCLFFVLGKTEQDCYLKNLAKMLERRLFWILTWRRNSGNHQKLVTLPAKVVQPLMLSSFSLDDYFIHPILGSFSESRRWVGRMRTLLFACISGGQGVGRWLLTPCVHSLLLLQISCNILSPIILWDEISLLLFPDLCVL